MNQQERDALREKHRCLESKVGPWCRSCMHSWPCDVIKVLDAWDAAKTPPEGANAVCNHTSEHFGFGDYTFSTCPKCGEKL